MAGSAPLIEQALACLRQGQVEEAMRLLALRLRVEPRDGAARHLVGVVLLQQGQPAQALDQFDLAGQVLPTVPTLHYNRGNALMALSRPADAVSAFDEALALQGDFAEAWFNRGNALHAMGQSLAALDSYQRAARARPSLVPAQRSLALLALQLGRDEQARAAFGHWIELEPERAVAHTLLGVALHRLGQVDQALAQHERAIAIDPGLADAWNNRGNALHDLGDASAALACFERALELQPDFPEAVNNRGMLQQERGRLDLARADYDRALALRPGYREALQRRAALSLLQGRLREGWADYEDGHARQQQARLPAGAPPFWEGQDLRGKSLLLSEPNGLGDTLQFFRFVPALLERGARLAFTGPRSVFAILSAFSDRVRMVEDPRGERFDFQCWLWSLPHYLQVDRATDLAPGLPWLQADPERVRRWRSLLAGDAFTIGLCWQGNPRRKIDRGRSIPLREFAPLARLPGVRLVSLQKHHGLDQLADLPEGMPIQVLEDFDEGPDAFVDSAAVLANLDLLVCADTSITHVAGAMGRPTWLALNPVPDWRWGLAGEASPWYPSVRLFRQQAQGDWAPVFEAMARQLAPLLAARDARGS